MADNNQQNKGGQPAEEQDVGRLRQVRRDKLAELQAQGKDPFVIVKYDQTHHTKEIRERAGISHHQEAFPQDVTTNLEKVLFQWKKAVCENDIIWKYFFSNFIYKELILENKFM